MRNIKSAVYVILMVFVLVVSCGCSARGYANSDGASGRVQWSLDF